MRVQNWPVNGANNGLTFLEWFVLTHMTIEKGLKTSNLMTLTFEGSQVLKLGVTMHYTESVNVP